MSLKIKNDLRKKRETKRKKEALRERKPPHPSNVETTFCFGLKLLIFQFQVDGFVSVFQKKINQSRKRKD